MYRRLARLRKHLSPSIATAGAARDDDDPSAALLAALEEAGAGTDLPLIGWDEIGAHDSPSDIWVVIDGVVYDMTEFIRSDHP